MTTMTYHRFLRLQQVRELLGLRTTAIYGRVASGLWPPSVALTRDHAGRARSVAWVETECRRVVAAMIAGASDDDLRALVAQMTAARQRTIGIDATDERHGRAAAS
jgi:prophage regulatory protein